MELRKEFIETVIPRTNTVATSRMEFFVHIDWLNRQTINIMEHIPKNKRSRYQNRWSDAMFDMVEYATQYRYATKLYRLQLISEIVKKQSLYTYYLNMLNRNGIVSQGLFMEMGKRLKALHTELIKMYNANKQVLLKDGNISIS